MQSVKIDKFLRLGIGALAVILVYVIYAGIHQRVVVAGDSAPDFSITADNGKTVSLSSFNGRLLVLNFWASWCGPCIEETPSLSQFAKDYADKGVVVLAVSVDKNPDAYRKFLQKFQPGFLYSRDLKLHEEYGTYMYPETYFINSKGKVVWKIPESPDPNSPATLDWSDAKVRKYIESLM